jgi:outer membrane lipoprotein-sorting protein
MALTAVGLAAAAPALSQTYYVETKTTSTVDGKSQTVTSKAWMKGATAFRIEQSAMGQTVLRLSDGDTLWIIHMGRKEGYRTKVPAEFTAMLKKLGRPIGNDLDAFLKQGAKKVGQETINGVKCDIYQRTDKRSGLTVNLWVQAGPGKLTRRQKLSGNVRAAAAPGQPMQSHKLTTIVEFTNWKVNIPIDDSMFRPPAGITIKDAPQPVAPPVPGTPGLGGKP